MANTTFSGPVRSLNGFQSISVNSTTGAVTVDATLGAATSVTTVTATGAVTAGGNVVADSGTAPAAGGMLGVQISSTAGLGIYVGSGAPTVSAAKGSLYLRTDGTTTNNRAYINTDGATTWTAITTAA